MSDKPLYTPTKNLLGGWDVRKTYPGSTAGLVIGRYALKHIAAEVAVALNMFADEEYGA